MFQSFCKKYKIQNNEEKKSDLKNISKKQKHSICIHNESFDSSYIILSASTSAHVMKTLIRKLINMESNQQ
jgi:hypothetical protein